jgi:hypothetical protein
VHRICAYVLTTEKILYDVGSGDCKAALHNLMLPFGLSKSIENVSSILEHVHRRTGYAFDNLINAEPRFVVNMLPIPGI